MKIVLWSLLALFLVGDALFVLPVHISSDTVTSSYDISFKTDTDLVKKVFLDSSVHFKLNLPSVYQAIYDKTDSSSVKTENPMLVNALVMHDLDFASLSFPFMKASRFKAVIPFSSTIRIANIPDMDSTALVGNITINGKLSIVGISSPVYARGLVEKELMRVLRTEMNKIEKSLAPPPVAVTVPAAMEEKKALKTAPRRKKK